MSLNHDQISELVDLTLYELWLSKVRRFLYGDEFENKRILGLVREYLEVKREIARRKALPT